MSDRLAKGAARRQVTSEDMAVPCDFCGDPVGFEGAHSGVCEHCWYGMRLDAEHWQATLKAKGREVHYHGGCALILEDGRQVLISRNPYAPGPGSSTEASEADDE